jgi:HEAT repeat protein
MAAQLGTPYDPDNPQAFLQALREAMAAEGAEGTIELAALMRTVQGLLSLPSDAADPENALLAMDKPSPITRAAAARALGKSGDERMVLPLLRALRGEYVPPSDWPDPTHPMAAMEQVGGDIVRMQAALALADLGEPAVLPLIETLGHADPQTRAAAAHALGLIGDPRADRPLARLLSDESDHVRLNALFALTRTADTSLLDAITPLANDPNHAIRDLANSLLKRLDPSLAFNDLLKSARSRHTNTQRTAILALGRTHDRRALDPLLALLNDPNESARYSAAEALGELGFTEAVGPLHDALEGASTHTREKIVEALSRLGSSMPGDDASAEVATPRGSPEVAHFVEMLGSPNWRERHKAAITLGAIGEVAAAPGLIRALERTDEVGPVFEAVVASLAGFGAEAIPHLRDALGHPTRPVRLGAVQALTAIKDGEALKQAGVLHALLEMAWSDPEAWVRKAAMPLLTKHKQPGLLPVLVEATKHKEYPVRWGAAIALGELGDREGVEPLIAAVKDRNRDVRRSAVTALGKLRDPRAVEALSAALVDPWDKVGYSAAKALRKMKARPHLGPIIEGLGSKDNAVRAYAARALGEYGDDTAAEPLGRTLEDTSQVVRWYAAEALGKVNSPQTGRVLLEALGKPVVREDGHLLSVIAASLGKLRYREATGALVGLLVHDRADVRHAAILALGEIGDERAIGPLQEVQHGDRGVAMAPSGRGAVRLSDAAREAVERIRSGGRS